MSTKRDWVVGDRAYYPDDGMTIEVTKVLDSGMLEGQPVEWPTVPAPISTYDPEELEEPHAAIGIPTGTVTDVSPTALKRPQLGGVGPNPTQSYGDAFGHLAPGAPTPPKIRMTGATADQLSGLVKPDEVVVVWAEAVAGVLVVVAETPDGHRYLLSDGSSIDIGSVQRVDDDADPVRD